eukprot:CAMPEP_0172385962 /NCGR_PEP_ID=MMETSP1061-20121228/3570_1 /TAXON_ID=37318 /ORGANISM="Pseudo-nitzschia pungens, Strain cf. pungens" /LENGTH=186 /DNA_ID=CAMNT_0013115173 /DNA_START=97 /DNA_END=657 /DNA_ORIENTATION=+
MTRMDEGTIITLRVPWRNLLVGFLLVVFAMCSSVCEGWTSHAQGNCPTATSRRVSVRNGPALFAESNNNNSNGVQSVDLQALGSDHETEGQLMADSIVRWLDAEWLPQQVHIDMADSAKRSYIRCREKNQDEIMDIMMQISNDLQEDWAKYNDDAFINAWDVGNYCSDYLVTRSGNEGCPCSAEIF